MYDNYEMNKKLMEDYNSGDPVKKNRAIEDLVKSVEPFIHKFLQAYKAFFSADSYDDLFQTALMAVIKALPKYNPEYSLTTFIPFEIKRELQKYISNLRGLSSHYSQRINNIIRTIDRLKELGIPNPTAKDVASVLGITERQVIEAMQMKDSSMVWNYESEEECSNLFNVHTESPEQIIERRELEKSLLEALQKLDELEKCCVLHCYGACGFCKMKYEQIAEKYQVTPYTVKITIQKALRHLRKSMNVSKKTSVGTQRKTVNSGEVPVFVNNDIKILIKESDTSLLDDLDDGFETLDLK